MYGAMLSAAASVTGSFRRLMILSLVVIGFLGIAPVAFGSAYLRLTFGVVGFIAVVAAFGLGMLGETADKVATYLAARAEITHRGVAEIKNDLKVLLSNLGRTVLVVIDDLDRLTPDEIRMVFQLVKANADFPSLVYLLLFQRETVERALSRSGEIDGPQFLAKLVQVRFDIPKISRRQLEDSVESAVREVVHAGSATQRFDNTRWSKLFASAVMPYFQTLRDVKRFGNALSFHFELYRRGDSFDANPVDLIGLEILREYEAPLYERLHNARELLTGQHGLISGPPDKRKQDAQALLEHARRPLCAKGILEEVFPPVALALSEAKISVAAFRSEWLNDLRPCHPEIFERYFRFALAAEDLSESELESLLNVVGDRGGLVQKLQEFNSRGLLRSAIARLHASDLSIVRGRAAPFITALFDIEREFMAQPTGGAVARAPADMEVIWIAGKALRQEAIGVRGALLREAVASTTALYLPMISFESSDEERKKAIDPLVSDEDAQLLKAVCIGNVRRASPKPEFLSHPRLRYILQFWANWASEQEVSKWFAETLESDSGLLSLLPAFTEGMNDVEGDRIVRTRYRFALEDFTRYTNVDSKLTERVRGLVSSSGEDELTCRLFLLAAERWVATGRKPYPQNLDDWTTLDQLE